MAVPLKSLISRLEAMQKIANETLAENPEALVGVDSLPGSEHDAKVPEDAKKPDPEVAQGQPAGAESASGAVVGGDAKVLNEGKLEIDEPLLNPEKKPLITDDALTAKTASARLESLVDDLLSDIKTKPAEKKASKSGKIELDNDTLSKIAAAQAAYSLGRRAAEAKLGKQASAEALKMIKDACIKAAQAEGLSPEDANSAADNAMTMAGMAPADAGAADAVAQDAADEAAGAQAAETAMQDAADEAQGAADAEAAMTANAEDAAAALPDDVTDEELGEAIVDLVQSGELDPDTAKAIVDEIAGDEGPSEDEAAQIIADGLESGEITPEQAQSIAAAIEGGDTSAADAAADVSAADAGAADAEAAAADAADEAAGAQAAEEAMKTAAAMIRHNAFSKVAEAVVANRSKAKSTGSPLLDKVAGILQKKAEAAKQAEQAESKEDQEYMAGFRKKAEELGVDPAALARYAVENAKAQANA